jgi:hypothetical protein
MLRPIRTTETVQLVCTFDDCVELKPGGSESAAPQWIFRDAPEVLAVRDGASVARVHLLNSEECDEWRAKFARENIDGDATARELARAKCDGIDGPGARAVAELPQLVQTTLGVAIMRHSVYIADPRKPISSE